MSHPPGCEIRLDYKVIYNPRFGESNPQFAKQIARRKRKPKVRVSIRFITEPTLCLILMLTLFSIGTSAFGDVYKSAGKSHSTSPYR